MKIFSNKCDRKHFFVVPLAIVGVLISVVVVMLIGSFLYNYWKEKTMQYKAQTRFLYSLDGGKTYTTMQEIPVNKNFYLSIDMAVFPAEKTKKVKKVTAKVTLFSTKIFDCYLANYPGTSITGVTDPLEDKTSYEFTLEASSLKTSAFKVIFDCMPLKEGRTKFQVTYDDTLDDTWDATGTIKYVAAEEKEIQ